MTWEVTFNREEGGMRSPRQPLQLWHQRPSRRRVLTSAVLAAAVLLGVVILGCESDGAEPVDEATPQETATAAAPQDGEVLTFDSDGVPIHYEVFGEGNPIILVHGFAYDLKLNWVDTGWVETLSATRQVVALDVRGHGLSGKPHDPEAYGGDEMQNDVVRLMDHLSIEKADLFGYSMGAKISLRLLLDHPSRFDSVVLGGIGNVHLRGTDGRWSAIAEALLAEDPSTITDPIALGYRAFAEANDNDLEALAAYLQSSRQPVEEADLNQVDVPVLIVNGEADGSPDELAAAIPGARLVMIPERNHLTVVPDARFKEAVVQFLAEVSPP